MDDYRHLLRGTRVVPIGHLMDSENGYADEQIVSIAGVIQSTKVKTTRNNSMMAYVTIEDDTAAIEMLCFSNALNQYGGYLRENVPVVITGKLSFREDKDPQIIINRVRPMTDYTDGTPQPEEITKETKLYLKLPTEQGPLFAKIRAILNMFPGENPVVVYFADTKVRRGSRCAPAESMLEELVRLLGKENVVLK
jgi:DNA polymerase-3 subunit alpha